MQGARQQQWQHILQLSQAMKQQLKQENWQAIIDLDKQRFALLEAFFKSPVSESEAAEVAQGIQSMLASDQDILELGNSRQQYSSNQVHELSAARRGVAAYQRMQK